MVTVATPNATGPKRALSTDPIGGDAGGIVLGAVTGLTLPALQALAFATVTLASVQTWHAKSRGHAAKNLILLIPTGAYKATVCYFLDLNS